MAAKIPLHPFEGIREEIEAGATPIDEQSNNQKRLTFDAIRQLHDVDARADWQGEALVDLQPGWIQTIAVALAHEPTFWAFCLDTAMGFFAEPRIILAPDWVVGPYLKGLYKYCDSFQEGYDKHIKPHEHDIYQAAAFRIREILSHAEDYMEEGSDPITSAKPLSTLNQDITAICLVIRYEKDEITDRNRLAKSLQPLGPMLSSLPMANKMLKSLDTPQSSERDTLSRFGADCLAQLKTAIKVVSLADMQPLSAFGEGDIGKLRLANATNFVKVDTQAQSRTGKRRRVEEHCLKHRRRSSSSI